LKEKESKRTSNFEDCYAFQATWQCPSLKFFAKLSFKKAEKSGRRSRENEEKHHVHFGVILFLERKRIKKNFKF
jgi:hypothetical protein